MTKHLIQRRFLAAVCGAGVLFSGAMVGCSEEKPVEQKPVPAAKPAPKPEPAAPKIPAFQPEGDDPEGQRAAVQKLGPINSLNDAHVAADALLKKLRG